MPIPINVTICDGVDIPCNSLVEPFTQKAVELRFENEAGDVVAVYHNTEGGTRWALGQLTEVIRANTPIRPVEASEGPGFDFVPDGEPHYKIKSVKVNGGIIQWP